MKELIYKIIKKLDYPVSNDNERRRKQLFFIEILLSMISIVMSIINIITHKNTLLIATLFMAFLSIINTFIIKKNKKDIFAASIIFVCKTFILFTYFIIDGGTEGFSTIWLLLVPACAPFAFGRKKGSIMALCLFFELVLFFYTPLKDIVVQCEDYSSSFIGRFPVLYLSFFLIGNYLEFIRERTNKELIALQNKIEYQSMHDQLTSLNNRYGLKHYIEEYLKNSDKCNFGLLILDVDHFKTVNDTFGHIVGDTVLKEIAHRINELYKDILIPCRWGGEEFCIFVKGNDCDELYNIAEALRNDINRPIQLENEKIHITVSIGGVCSKELEFISNDDKYKKMIEIADSRLYEAKNQGRNKSICK